jgi:hypothetical protein
MALYAFDGTGKAATIDDNEELSSETNVAHFHGAYDGAKAYFQGVGTKLGAPGMAIGGAFGAGDLDRLHAAYKALCERWQAGDHIIDIIGFSRGAALALDFANNVEKKGIRRPGSDEVLEPRPAIRFLGLWDVVGAFGLAINERRQAFRVTRLLNGYEVWFRGVHSDIGGGNGNTDLSNISLRWMFRKAIAAELPINEAAIAAHQIKPDADIRPATTDFIKNAYRSFLKGDRFHYTVDPRAEHNNPPDGSVKETEADELKSIAMADLGPIAGARLNVGEQRGEIDVLARNYWNTVGLEVKQGERYDISATGQWVDRNHPSTAAGYDKVILRPFKRTRRVRKANWFCLIAAVHPSRVLQFEVLNDANGPTDFLLALERTVKHCDDESQLVAISEQGSITVDRDGYLYLFANDTPGFYANNDGEVEATIKRTQ